MKRLYSFTLATIAALFFATTISAQQLPDYSFESWTRTFSDTNEGSKPQLTNWYSSNVVQTALGITFSFNFIEREAGHTGSYCAKIADREVGAAGITEAAPGYFTLGEPWQFLDGLNVSEATAGTFGGINFTYRPDSMEVWIKRTGDHWKDEDFHLLFYSWTGTSQAKSYQGKNGKCTTVTSKFAGKNEESDIRQALDANKCGTDQKATQIAEGWVRDRQEYGEWTKIVVPIYYASDEKPQMCNVIFSAGNYPNFRANSGLYKGNALYVDDVKLIYSSKIDHLYIGGKEWKGFDPASTDMQVYSVGNVSQIPEVYGMRGVGTLTNARGTSANFIGRKLSSSEMTITQQGKIDGDPMVIEVKAEDGSSTTTYKIQFVSKQSTNARLASISINDEKYAKFQPMLTQYNIELPYGTTSAPKVTFEKAEDAQQVSITQPTSTTGTATIKVTAQDGKTSMTYTLNFSVAKLSDITLEDLMVDGETVTGFLPTKRTYTVELPLGTTAAPAITWKSAYKQGEQTIKLLQNDLNSGAQVSVTAPGTTKENIYKITYKITASTYSYLKDITLDGKSVEDFTPERKDYYFNLTMGTTALPKIAWTQGDRYQTVTIEEGGLDDVTKITVIAASGAKTIYRLNFTLEKSTYTDLKAIYLNGTLMTGFEPTTYEYVISLGTGVTTAPTITYDKGDEYQTVEVRDGGLNGTSRIVVKAGDGSSQAYTIRYTQTLSTVNTLKMIYIDGVQVANFNANTLEYSYQLPQGTTTLPTITFDKGDDAQTVTPRSFSGLTGDYKLAVKPQSGTTQTYIIHFSVLTSSNVNLKNIYYNGTAIPDFTPSNTSYSIALPMGTTALPTLTWDVADQSQRVVYTAGTLNGNASTLLVRAEDGTMQTYKITFTVAVAGVSTLLDIKVGGVSLEGFTPDKTDYSVALPIGTTQLPTITWTQNDEYQTVRATYGGVNGTTRIVVRAQNGNTTTYTISFSVGKSTNCSLASIALGGKPMSQFKPDQLAYDTIFPSGTSRVPTLSYTKGDASQTVYVQNGSFSTPATLRVVAESGAEQTYTITFGVERSENASLSMIYLDGEALPNFTPEKLDYTFNLPLDATVCPTITVDKGDGQRVSITMPLLTGTASILVEPETGDANIYTIRFTQAASTNSQLAAIYLDGVALQDFNPETTEYQISLSAFATALPKITYSLADEYEKAYLTVGSMTEPSYIKVIAADDTYTLYTLTFTQDAQAVSSEASLSAIMLNGNAIAGFDAETYTYDYQLGVTETTAPVISAVKADEAETIVITQPTTTGEGTITVIAADQTEQTYTVNIRSNRSSDCSLTMIQLDGFDLTDFDPATLHYTVALPAGTTSAPVISVLNEPTMTVNIQSAGLNETTYIYVTAEDGTTQTYTVALTVEKSSNADLAGITIGGTPLSGFDPVTTDYTYALALGAGRLGNVVALKSNDNQQIEMTMPARDGVGVIKVTAEDGLTTKTYTLTVTAEMSDNAELSMLRVDGADLLVAGQTNYTVDLHAGLTPVVEYAAGDDMQTIGIVDNGAQGATIIVIAENGTARIEYTITYNILPSTDATLKDILVFDGATFMPLAGFNPATDDYTIELPWRTQVVPALWVEQATEGQTVVIDYGAVNEKTTITVTAQDGINTKQYAINFPVEKSANTALEDVTCNIADVNFSSSTYTYNIELPYKTETAPMLYYTKQEQEQQVIYTYAPLGETSTIEVIAENGDSKTYEFNFTVLLSDAENTLPLVNINTGASTILVTLGTNYNVTVDLPYGTKDFTVEVPVKNYDEQTVQVLNGGVHNQTIIDVYPNRGSEAKTTYTLTPNLDTTYPTSLTSISIDGTPLAGFEPTKHVYIVSVVDEPLTVSATAYNSEMTVDNENIHYAKQRRIAVEDPNEVYETSYYDVYFYYLNDLNFDLGFNNFDDVTNTLKGAGLLDMSDMATEAVSLLCGKTEIIIGDFKDRTITGRTPHNWNSLVNAQTTGLKDGEDMGHLKIATKGLFGSCLTLMNIDIKSAMNTIFGDVVTDYYPQQCVQRIESPLREGQYAVRLTTQYLTTSAESMPSILSLSEQSVKIGMWMLADYFSIESINDMMKAASSPSALSFGEPITFRNSPDSFSVWIKPEKHQKIDKWKVNYIVNGTDLVNYEGSYSSTNWVNVKKDFAYNENPLYLDIRINSTPYENPQDMYVAGDGRTASNQYTSTLVVDDLQLLYRSDLTGLKVNGIDAVMSGTDFTVDLNADDYYGIPSLTFLTGVPDQMQNITWNSDYTEATILNLAEDLTTQTEYKLTINRAASTNNTLAKLFVDGIEYSSFVPTTYEYTIGYDSYIPDLQAIVASAHSKATLTLADGKTIIAVTAEDGNTQNYTITWQKNSAAISTEASFTATKIASANEQTETFVEFTKAYDAQTIVFDETSGTITCTASDLTTTSQRPISDYLSAPLTVITSAQLTWLANEDMTLMGFAPALLDYTADHAARLAFEREYATDKAVVTITDTKTTLHLHGSGEAIDSDNADLIYTVATPALTTDNAYLQTILVNGTPLADFYETEEEYTLDMLNAKIEPLLAEDGQTMTIEYRAGKHPHLAPGRKRLPVLDSGIKGTYIIKVTASDGVTEHEIHILLRHTTSSDASLYYLEATGETLVPAFDPTVLQYTVNLTTPQPKTADPVMPSIIALSNSDGQKIEIEDNGVNATSYIIVTAENGTDQQQYELTVNAAPSSYSALDIIEVNGEQLTLTAGVTTYDVVLHSMAMPMVDATSKDKYVTITPSVSTTSATILVEAEDGVNSTTYTFNFSLDPALTDATLADIKVGGASVTGFNPTTFIYDIVLPNGTTALPILNIVKRYESQVVSVYPNGTSNPTVIDVVAADGVTTEQYVLNFSVAKSDCCTLNGIAINYEPLAAFSPANTTYTINLKSDDFTVQTTKGEEHQTVETIVTPIDAYSGTITINVTSEDETCTNTYTITYYVDHCSLSTLDNILLDGVGLSGFSSSTISYSVLLPVGTTTAPALAVVTGCDGQLISITANGVNETSTITVTAPDNSSSTTYSIFFEVEKSEECHLDMITEDGDMLPGFDRDIRYYTFDKPVGTRLLPVLDYVTTDAAATVRQEEVWISNYRRETRFYVTAEDGVHKMTYSVAYNIMRSAVDTLSMIYLDGVELSGFVGTQNYYSVDLPVGTTTLPLLTADKGDEWQAEPVIVAKNQTATSVVYTIDVTAENNTHRTYTVNISILKSSLATLQNILVDGMPIEVNGFGYTGSSSFDPTISTYTIRWAVGTPKSQVPNITAQQGDEYQTIVYSSSLTQLEGTVVIRVFAENGSQNTYTIISELEHSYNDELAMITLDGADLDGFISTQNTYQIELPIGTTSFPAIGYEQAETWQTVSGPTLLTSTATTATYTLTVTAEAGNSRTYTLNFRILQSTNDCLDMIYLDNQALDGFIGTQNYYSIVLPYGTSVLPTLTWDEGDQWQTIQLLMGALNGESYIVVTAQNGSVRTYSLHFSVAPSSNTELDMIYTNGIGVDNYDSEVYDYTITLPYGETTLPKVTFDKHETEQTVTLQTIDRKTTITVTAADGVSYQEYTLTYVNAKSTNNTLRDISLDGVTIEGFSPDITDYDIELPAGTSWLPTITWLTADEEQTVFDSTDDLTYYTLDVYAGDGTPNTYTINFTVALSDENRLAQLRIDGVLIDGWNPDTLNYYYEYPIGTEVSDLPTTANLTYITVDPDATVQLIQTDETTMSVVVIAPNGDARVYVIEQHILLSSNSLLSDLTIDGITVKGFDPTVFNYEYELYDGQLPAAVDATAQDTAAEVAITMGNVGELTYIYCTAEDGSESVYTILFRVTDINPNADPSIGSCYWQHVPGTSQYKAITICNNVRCAVFDISGHRLDMQDVEKVDPNKVTVGEDQYGNQVILNTAADANGTLFDIPAVNQTYFYVFYVDNRAIHSGKFTLAK